MAARCVRRLGARRSWASGAIPSSLSRPTAVERARPLLGTIVVVRVSHADAAVAHAAVAAAFDEIAQVHALMSFHEAGSDLSRINRRGLFEDVRVDPRTAAVIAFAVELARSSGGVFDPCVGRRAVEAGDLPAPFEAPRPDRRATWRDIGLEGTCVRLSRAAWLDLGGVAKGYAVDRAVERLRALAVRHASVNAGGDLRVIGEASEQVRLAAGSSDRVPVVEIAEGSLASSGGAIEGMARHFRGAAGAQVARTQFASVAAPTCMVADGLTKVVLAQGSAAASLLTAYGASAWTFEPAAGWRSIEAAS